MKVLVLNTPFMKMYSRASRSPAVTKSSTLYYPYWLAYAVGVLEDNGFDVKFIDAPAMDLDHDQVYEIAQEFKPELTVLDTTTGSINNDVATASKIKDLTGSKTVMVGTHASATAEETINISEKVDAVAVAEYDYTVRDLAIAIRDNTDITKVKGLWVRVDGNINNNGRRNYIKNLDELPFASRVYKKHFDRETIDRFFYGESLHPVMTILSGRGCPHQCAFCVYPQTMTGHQYRYRSVTNFVDELEYINKEFPYVKEIFVEDDTLTVHKDRAVDIANEIMRRGLKITWSANSRADIDLETLEAIGKSGCRLLCVGFESGDQRVLDNMQKKIKVDNIYDFVSNAKKAKVLIHGCFLVGNPGESKESLQKTLDMALKINPDTAQFYPIMIYPGTKAYDWAARKGYITKDSYDQWLTKDGLHNSVVSTPDVSWDELVVWCDEARRKFYLRPSYVFSKLKQGIKEPKEFGRLLRGGTTLLKFIFRGSLPEKKAA
ncbi:MAG: radical SAM protein [Chitinivibrionales bacterium]|nr:radical SAM protein [Chitinivibrionales bacterium]